MMGYPMLAYIHTKGKILNFKLDAVSVQTHNDVAT